MELEKIKAREALAKQELRAAQEAVAQNLKELKAAQEAVWESKDAAHEALVRAVQAKAAWEAAEEAAYVAVKIEADAALKAARKGGSHEFK